MKSTKELILAGGGGCMRELVWQMQESGYKILGYCAPAKEEADIPYLGNDDYLKNLDKEANVVLCFGNAKLRKRVYEYISVNEKLSFPEIILDGASVSPSATIGRGAIICKGATVTTNVTVSDFAFINMAAHVSHDCRIGKFATVSPRAALAGNVKVGDNAFIGINATVIQGISIGNDVTIGAGAVVITNIPKGVTAVGVPAKINK